MKLFVVLALYCSFFSTRATPLPFEFLDCDDPDVFEAVDTALQKYNGDSTSANQFALYMVTEAKRTVGPDKQFHVKYEIRETTCATEENKIWKDCDYKAPTEARTGECTAQVYISNAEKTTNVSQDCKIVPVQPMIPLIQGVCLGCFHTISNDNPKVVEILEKAILKFNKESDEAALFKLVSTVEAKRQRTAKCDAKAHENHQEEIVHIASTCNIPAIYLETDYDSFRALEKGVQYYSMYTVVAGQNYHLIFFVQKTNCSKKEFEKLHEDCEATTDSTAMVRMPPGFTPLRSFAVQVDETPSPETGATTEAVNPPDITLINGLLDHTESPLPKCPGKPWKQILDLSIPSILPRDFIDEDLLPSVTENIDLKTENPLSPQNKEMSFDLADALE
ncbi:hypothetical protein ASZ78_010537 [Callipepla squamata]|uniref:Cystatin kininogen-type domain-containing protein n=1 Tax=Callipepla squamata TaxID=9009 RepID=A0A226N3Q1_CALSU|nr:hypothetical protein ASZ78_010537 [Callipepla squamata]